MRPAPARPGFAGDPSAMASRRAASLPPYPGITLPQSLAAYRSSVPRVHVNLGLRPREIWGGGEDCLEGQAVAGVVTDDPLRPAPLRCSDLPRHTREGITGIASRGCHGNN